MKYIELCTLVLFFYTNIVLSYESADQVKFSIINLENNPAQQAVQNIQVQMTEEQLLNILTSNFNQPDIQNVQQQIAYQVAIILISNTLSFRRCFLCGSSLIGSCLGVFFGIIWLYKRASDNTDCGTEQFGEVNSSEFFDQLHNSSVNSLSDENGYCTLIEIVDSE